MATLAQVEIRKSLTSKIGDRFPYFVFKNDFETLDAELDFLIETLSLNVEDVWLADKLEHFKSSLHKIDRETNAESDYYKALKKILPPVKGDPEKIEHFENKIISEYPKHSKKFKDYLDQKTSEKNLRDLNAQIAKQKTTSANQNNKNADDPEAKEEVIKQAIKNTSEGKLSTENILADKPKGFLGKIKDTIKSIFSIGSKGKPTVKPEKPKTQKPKPENKTNPKTKTTRVKKKPPQPTAVAVVVDLKKTSANDAPQNTEKPGMWESIGSNLKTSFSKEHLKKVFSKKTVKHLLTTKEGAMSLLKGLAVGGGIAAGTAAAGAGGFIVVPVVATAATVNALNKARKANGTDELKGISSFKKRKKILSQNFNMVRKKDFWAQNGHKVIISTGLSAAFAGVANGAAEYIDFNGADVSIDSQVPANEIIITEPVEPIDLDAVDIPQEGVDNAGQGVAEPADAQPNSEESSAVSSEFKDAGNAATPETSITQTAEFKAEMDDYLGNFNDSEWAVESLESTVENLSDEQVAWRVLELVYGSKDAELIAQASDIVESLNLDAQSMARQVAEKNAVFANALQR